MKDTKIHVTMKYPIGIQSFDRIISEGYIYVDKTDMLYSLVKEGSIYFLSRPRRFGKSLLISTLENYFLGRKELFKGLKIDALEKDWLEYPNNEVKRGFLALVAANYLQSRENVSYLARELNKALKTGDTERFRELLTSFLSSIPYDVRRKEDERERERYFQYTFYLILRLLGVYAVRAEERQSRGRVDCVVETPDHVYVFDFKLDGTAAEALRQIEEKGYALPYAADKRKLYKIGVNFSSETGTIDDWLVG